MVLFSDAHPGIRLPGGTSAPTRTAWRQVEAPMAERTMDGRSTADLLRQRWRVLAVGAFLGVLVGVAYATLVPVQLASRALVLLPSSAGGSGGDSTGGSGEIVTQVQIVLSTPVLGRAGQAVTPRLSAAQVLDRITVDAATSQLIEIEGYSPKADAAQALTQAVAEAYVSTRLANAKSVTGATVGDLTVRRTALTAQVGNLQDQINATNQRLETEDPKSPAGLRDAQLKTQLVAEQAETGTRLDKVKNDLAASGVLTADSSVASIIQSAAPAIGPGRVQGLVTWGFAGALIGAAVAALVVAVRARRDPRLRARDDLADAVGSTVLADVRSRPQRSVAEWSALFETYQASAVDAWAFRQLLRALTTPQDQLPSGRAGAKRGGGRVEHPRSVAVIALSGDPRGLAVGPQLAAFAASLGLSTRFVVASGHDSAASLWAACSTERASDLRPGLALEARTEAPVPIGQALVPLNGASFDDIVTGSAMNGSHLGAGATGPSPADASAIASTIDAISSTIEAILGSSKELGAAGDETPSNAVPDHGFSDRDVPDHGVPDDEPERSPVAPEPAPVVSTVPASLPKLRVVPKHHSADLTIVLVVADSDEPELHKVPPTEVTLLALAPGVASREQLARVAVAVDDGGRRIDGVVVANPDPSDRTTGRRTLDERARQAPLPVRITGIGQAPMSGNERGTTR
jgi:capsular polysaccharide biosynthesis protein